MIRCAAVGDLMLGDSTNTVGFGVHSRYPGRSIATVFAALTPHLAGSDIVLGNLECPLTSVGTGETRWARDQMRGDPDYATALRNAGFTVISVGNNHAMQHGDDGFAATVAALRAAGIQVAGLRGAAPWACDPVHVHTASGASAIVLAYSWRPRQYGTGAPPYADATLEQVLEDVHRAASLVDAVVVSLHWGDEFVTQPAHDDVQAADAIIAAGAACVVGHHPHVTRPVVSVRNRPVAFSLGNAVSDMLWMPALRAGYLLTTTLDGDQTSFRVQRLATTDDYCIAVHDDVAIAELSLSPLEPSTYRAAVSHGLATQRRAQYGYLVRNAGRLAPGVLGTLVRTTVRNKWQALRGRATVHA